MRTTIDAAGRVIVPKAIRDEMGLTGGQELEIRAGDGAPGRPLDPRDGPFEVDPEEEGWVNELVRRRLPTFSPTPLRSETCIYTMTPDQDFVLDRSGPIVVGSACSGHGFKFGPLLGDLLADLALDGEAGMPAARFALPRFVR